VRLRRETSVGLLFEEKHPSMFYFGMACWFLFGWVFLHDPDSRTAWRVLLGAFIFGVAVPAAGLWQERLEVDLEKQSYEYRKGFWPALRVSSGTTSEFVEVLLSSQEERSDYHPFSRQWIIELVNGRLGVSVKLGEYHQEARARSEFQRLARKLSVAARDTTEPRESNTGP